MSAQELHDFPGPIFANASTHLCRELLSLIVVFAFARGTGTPLGDPYFLELVTVRKLEARIILNALHANNWNRKKAARSLDISYRALLYKLKEVGIPQRRSSSAGKREVDDKAE